MEPTLVLPTAPQLTPRVARHSGQAPKMQTPHSLAAEARPRGITPLVSALISTVAVAALGACVLADPPPANTWARADIDWDKALRSAGIRDAAWSTTDGYSDNIHRSKTSSIIIRTGVRSKAMGYSPGFYTNASVEWDLATDTAKVIDIANWGGGSYGHGRLLPAYARHRTPTPRHTYDGVCYVPQTDSMVMMLGANWRIGGRGADAAAKAELKKDGGRTWTYSFRAGRWTCVEDNVWKHFKCSPYENHMQHWAAGGKLLFLNDRGDRYAEFDLATNTWKRMPLANACPMSLYNARSTWDSERSLWVFRLGPRLCTLNPATRTFAELPNCYRMPIPSRDEVKEMIKAGKTPDGRLRMKGVCYISKHDVYLVTGPTGDDTAVYDVGKEQWTALTGGDIKLPNGYCQYDPKLDIVGMNYQLDCFKFRYVPEKE